MRKLVLALVLLLLLAGVAVARWWIREAGRPVPLVSPEVEQAAPSSPPRPELRGRPAPAPDGELLAAARALLGADERLESCAPYTLYTDVEDARLVAACGLLASRLDALYEARYGVRPVGEPAEAIVLFSALEDYRRFARDQGVSLGYAGYAIPARGLAIFYSGAEPFETFLTTLAHELTHLVNRRALGINLPPWLSEGLADGLGDTATPAGYVTLDELRGRDVAARRLREAVASGRAGSVERLVHLKRGEFDRGVVSFDYEQSALLVRFLVTDPGLRPGFRAFLRRVATGAAPTAGSLLEALGVSWTELDERFSAWVLGG